MSHYFSKKTCESKPENFSCWMPFHMSVLKEDVDFLIFELYFRKIPDSCCEVFILEALILVSLKVFSSVLFCASIFF